MLVRLAFLNGQEKTLSDRHGLSQNYLLGRDSQRVTRTAQGLSRAQAIYGTVFAIMSDKALSAPSVLIAVIAK